jgi:hypothetical protein
LIQNNANAGIYSNQCVTAYDIDEIQNSLKINNSIVKNNGSLSSIFKVGGIYSCGLIEIRNSEISGNIGNDAGGILIDGSLNSIPNILENSTNANNKGLDDGGTGGVRIYQNSTSFGKGVPVTLPDTVNTIRNNTISNNTTGGASVTASSFSSKSNNLSLTNNLITNTLSNSILCEITPPTPVVAINLGNVSSNPSCTGFSKTSFNSTTGFGSQTLTSTGNLRPNVGSGGLGGKTRALPVVQNSIAINAGIYTSCLPQDQFGNNRLNTSNISGVLATACEAGAFELPTDPNPPVVPVPAPTTPPVTPTPTATVMPATSGFGGLIRTGGEAKDFEFDVILAFFIFFGIVSGTILNNIKQN